MSVWRLYTNTDWIQLCVGERETLNRSLCILYAILINKNTKLSRDYTMLFRLKNYWTFSKRKKTSRHFFNFFSRPWSFSCEKLAWIPRNEENSSNYFVKFSRRCKVTSSTIQAYGPRNRENGSFSGNFLTFNTIRPPCYDFCGEESTNMGHNVDWSYT